MIKIDQDRINAYKLMHLYLLNALDLYMTKFWLIATTDFANEANPITRAMFENNTIEIFKLGIVALIEIFLYFVLKKYPKYKKYINALLLVYSIVIIMHLYLLFSIFGQ